MRAVSAPARSARAPSLAFALCLCAAAASPLAGCAASRPDPRLAYGDRARAEYDAALELYNGGDYDGARERFRQVRRDYALSSWGWQAELRLADIDFKQEHFSEAITAYRAWIRYHSAQAQVGYARFMIAKCYYAQIPTDSIVTPAPWERDLSSASDAEDALVRFVRDNPNTEHTAEARQLLRSTRNTLARAEIAVAEFYASRQHYDAAIARLRSVLENYRDSGREAEALLRIGETLLTMNRRDDAREAFAGVLRSYADSTFAAAASRYLDFLGPPPARPTPAATAAPTASAAPAASAAPPAAPSAAN